MSENCEKEIRVPAIRENVAAISAFTEDTLNEMECSPKVTMKFLIAMDEIITNVVNYSGAKEMTVQISKEDGVVSVRILDDGKPFDPLQHADPDITLDASEREIGGLGIYMVKKSMDDVIYFYEDGRNVLKLELSTGKETSEK